MSDQYVGEIRTVAFNFAPQGWAMCNGQLLPINQNTALFSLLGTYYGGDGRTTFALPNLQARFPVHAGSSGEPVLGEAGGSATVALAPQEMPAHTHAVRAHQGHGDTPSPAGAVWAAPHVGRMPEPTYSGSGAPTVSMASGSVGYAGSGQAHENRSPFVVVNFIIALEGYFPPRS